MRPPIPGLEPPDRSAPSPVRHPKADRHAHQSLDRNHMTSQHPKSGLLTCCCKVSHGETQYPHYYVIKYSKVKYNIVESVLVCNLQKEDCWFKVQVVESRQVCLPIFGPEPHDKSALLLVCKLKVNRCAYQSSYRNHLTSHHSKSMLFNCYC